MLYSIVFHLLQASIFFTFKMQACIRIILLDMEKVIAPLTSYPKIRCLYDNKDLEVVDTAVWLFATHLGFFLITYCPHIVAY